MWPVVNGAVNLRTCDSMAAGWARAEGCSKGKRGETGHELKKRDVVKGFRY